MYTTTITNISLLFVNMIYIGMTFGLSITIYFTLIAKSNHDQLDNEMEDLPRYNISNEEELPPYTRSI